MMTRRANVFQNVWLVLVLSNADTDCSLERIPIAFTVKKSLLITAYLRSCDICVTELQVYPVSEMFWKDFFFVYVIFFR